MLLNHISNECFPRGVFVRYCLYSRLFSLVIGVCVGGGGGGESYIAIKFTNMGFFLSQCTSQFIKTNYLKIIETTKHCIFKRPMA